MSSHHSFPGHSQDDIRRRRLLFRCWHRGTQESDRILGRFAEAYVADFDDAQLQRFEALLDCADVDLFDWIIGGSAPPEKYDRDLICLLRAFARSHSRNPRSPTTIEE